MRSPWQQLILRRIRKTEDGHWMWLGHWAGTTPVMEVIIPPKKWYVSRSARSLAYELVNGKRVRGQFKNKCGVPSCVNPEHTESTMARNIQIFEDWKAAKKLDPKLSLRRFARQVGISAQRLSYVIIGVGV